MRRAKYFLGGLLALLTMAAAVAAQDQAPPPLTFSRPHLADYDADSLAAPTSTSIWTPCSCGFGNST